MSEPNDRERKLAEEFVQSGTVRVYPEQVAVLLAAYREELTTPDKVCEAFERLMRDACPYDNEEAHIEIDFWYGGDVTIQKPVPGRRKWFDAGSLAEAFAVLVPAAPPMSPERAAELAQDDADTLAVVDDGDVG